MTDLQTEIPPVIRDNLALVAAVDRLNGITGFITVVHDEHDLRPQVFNRRDHVARVDTTAQLLHRQARIGEVMGAVRDVVWLHDLNRWPFAHNLEKGRYDQSRDLAHFLSDRGLQPTDEALTSIEAIHAWDSRTTSPVGLVGLAADKLAGLLEDLLLSVCGLNIHFDYFPTDVLELAGLAADQTGRRAELRHLALTLHRDRDLASFTAGFHGAFIASVRAATGLLVEGGPEGSDSLRTCVETVRAIRGSFVAEKIFPINNELVCRKSLLEERAFQPVFAGPDRPTSSELLTWDDRRAAEIWSDVTGPSQMTFKEFVPDLDVVTRTRHELALVSW